MAPLLEYYLGMEPELEQRLRHLGRYPTKDLRAFYAKQEERRATYQSGDRVGKEYTKYNWARRLHTGVEDRELLTRHEMVHGVGTILATRRTSWSPDFSMLSDHATSIQPFRRRPVFKTRTRR